MPPVSPWPLVTTLALALSAAPIAGQTTGSAPPAMPATASSPLAGTWVLVAADQIDPDGVRRPSYGPSPHGVLMVDAEGRYSLQIFRSGRRTFASGSKRRGTEEEYADAVRGMSSHVGRCFIDPATNLLVFQIELASFPNWEGTEQRRSYTLTGDDLAYRIPATAEGDGIIAISEWKRVR